MTDGLRPVINSVDLGPNTEVHTFTAPAPSPASINDAQDIMASFGAAWQSFKESGEPNGRWDGVLVACFSVHPLVGQLEALFPSVAVTGIFEASVLTAVSLARQSRDEHWGIVTTGKFWEEHLSSGVAEYLGGSDYLGKLSTFAGVESTGLNASDFHHGVDPAVVTQRIREATGRLLERG
ncbi:hypothetical protein PG994_004144 [Apiospora phragmitis]|uniref:Hydantoin racemase n=1 Tax=Apiospora phragmitis TaxID=2905665 RepID=A0ABR1VPR9_9PEZI